MRGSRNPSEIVAGRKTDEEVHRQREGFVPFYICYFAHNVHSETALWMDLAQSAQRKGRLGAF